MDGLAYLKARAPWTGSGKFSLDPMRTVLSALDDPQDRVPAVHVAGTNGKGSVSVALASIGGAAGLRVGLTTSPHLVSVAERVVIDGAPVDLSVLNDALVAVRKASERTKVELSHFEAITCAFFHLCAELQLDLQVVEVGLGGRLDATNVVRRPLACGIVSIDFDHEDVLGPTLRHIAREKAGIIKDRAKVIIGDLPHDATEEVEAIAQQKLAVMQKLQRDFFVREEIGQGIEISSDSFGQLRVKPSLVGSHQAENMAVAALMAITAGFDKASVIKGIEGVFWPARLERVVYRNKECLLDACHNPAGIRSLVAYLKARHTKRPALVFGALATKRWQEMLQILAPEVAEVFILKPESSMAVEPHDIADFLSGIGVRSSVLGSDYESALRVLAETTAPLSVVAGSIYMVGKLRGLMNLPEVPLWKRLNR